MFDTDGKTVRGIPADKVAAAQQGGLQIARQLSDKNGVKRYIPADKYDDALRSGMTDSQKMQPTKFDKPQETRTGKVMSWATRNAPMIGGAAGATIAGAATMGAGAPEGAGAGAALAAMIPGVTGAAAGGAAGSAIQSKAESGKVSGKEAIKQGAEQGAWEAVLGPLGKGITKTAQLLGVDEAIMKFALKSGEDFDRGLNPAGALNKWRLKALATKDLYQKTVQQIGSMTKTADAVMEKAAPYSSTVRPYAVIKGVITQARDKAARVGDSSIANAMDDMLDTIGKEFNTGGPQSAAGAVKQDLQHTMQGAANVTSVGRMQAELAARDAAEKLPTDRVMTIKEANALKQQWGESVNWAKDAPQDKLQSVFKAEQDVRRDVYQALNSQIADSMGGNEGKTWHSINHDVFNLMEAKSLIQKSASSHSDYGKTLGMKALDAMRNPGPASVAAGAARGAGRATEFVGNNLPQIGRGAVLGANAAFGQAPQ
jgi:outer membrane lipoprotein SlyB